MDVSVIQRSAVSFAAAALPVVSSAAPERGQPRNFRPTVRIEADVVEFSRGNRVKAAESPLIVNSNRNIRSGSHVYHDEATNRFVVEIVNENDEVIRQLPSEEALEIAGRFRRLVGLIFDQSV